MYRATQNRKFQFDLSLTSGSRTALTLIVVTESLRWYLEVSRTRSVFIGIFAFDTVVVLDKIRHGKIVKHFYFDLTCDVIGDPEFSNVGFPR